MCSKYSCLCVIDQKTWWNEQEDRYVLPWNSPGSPCTQSHATYWLNVGFRGPWERQAFPSSEGRVSPPAKGLLTTSSILSLAQRRHIGNPGAVIPSSFSSILENPWLAQGAPWKFSLTKLMLMCCDFKGKAVHLRDTDVDSSNEKVQQLYKRQKSLCWKLNEISQTKCWAKETRHPGVGTL